MAHEEPSKLPWIILGGVAFALLLVIVWQEVRQLGSAAEIGRLSEEVSRTTVEARQNVAAIELEAHAYRTEAEQLRGQLAVATADRPLDHLREFGSEQDLEQCRQMVRSVFVNRLMPLAGKSCSTGKPDAALQAAWKAVARDASDWIEFFRPRLPTFGPGCFEKVAVENPAAGRADNDITEYSNLQTLIDSFCIISPDRNLCLYLDYPTGEPDSSARIWDLNNNRELWKSDCGTPCHWDYAVWVDANTAAVIGMSESAFDPLPILLPQVRLVQVKDRQVSIIGAWRGPEMDVSATTGGASYAAQHKKWLTRKGKTRAQ